MDRKKKWRPITSQDDLDKVTVGTKVRNNKSGQEFEIVKVGEMINGVLQVEARPTSPLPQSFEYKDGKWRFA